MHQKYGSIVRIAPGHYSVNDISAVKTIYAPGSKFPKSAWYDGWRHPDPDRWTLFPERDTKKHGKTVYSGSSLDPQIAEYHS